MTQRFFVLSVLLLSLALAGPAAAAIKGGEGSLTLGAGGYVFDGQEHLHAGPELLVRLGYDITEYVGIEGSFGYVNTEATRRTKLSGSDLQAHTYLYRADALFYLMPRSTFVPFLVAGGGVKQEIGSSMYGNRTSALLNAGIGAKLFVSDNVALRGEYRQIGTTDYAQHLNYEAAMGITWYFGRESRPSAAPREWTLTDPAAMAAKRPAPVPSPEPAPAAAPTEPAVEIKPSETAPVAEPMVQPAAKPVAEAVPPAVPVALADKQPETIYPSTTIPVVRKVVVVGNTIAIHTSAPVSSYKTMTLEKPARLAIDLFGAVNGMTEKKVAVNQMDIKGVRIGTHPDKVRVVIDAAGSRLPPYRLEKSATGLDLVITY
ncbi:outer membrane beta-barrel protein [Geomobilimonas luticola]|uniref:Outer membrane beta-barrel protein n=1 Tax=Geomobilimonas luticola TaxID=1114878 RepID=A0ABS5SCN2_9BACT|nr:outer membrane beta-barrel protein [Geomobilimonas luticola]MBT0653130.1 outer membrane beta-barrel protein [Geomobilimonas luticola]